MKKLMIASAIAMTMTAGSAMASQGDVQFFGTVTAKTCDLAVEQNGNVTNMVQLGSVTNSGNDVGVVQTFALKPVAGNNCADIATAHMAWSAPEINANGIGNKSGAATDSYVKLTAIHSVNVAINGGNDQEIKSGQNTLDYAIQNNGLADDGFRFKAQLIGGTIAGEFNAAAAYSVSYN